MRGRQVLARHASCHPASTILRADFVINVRRPLWLDAPFEQVIDTKTAKALDLAAPAPLLDRADEVIE